MLLPAQLRRLIFRRDAYRQCFATPAGKAVLADLARFCGARKVLFAQGEPETTAFNLGLRAAFLRIQEGLTLTDADVARLVEEAKETTSD